MLSILKGLFEGCLTESAERIKIKNECNVFFFSILLFTPSNLKCMRFWFIFALNEMLLFCRSCPEAV